VPEAEHALIGMAALSVKCPRTPALRFAMRPPSAYPRAA
jgi:hypothetical protein